MNCNELISELKSLSSEKYKANVVKLGIPEGCSLGVSTGEVRKLAKTVKKSNDLAYELWHTGYHEARLLAVLVFDPKTLSVCNAGALMEDVISWDLCDHLCKNLLIKIKGYETLIGPWCASDKIYIKRAAFTLMASAAVHEKALPEALVDTYFSLIETYSVDDREHVKKAVSWALRELGKMDMDHRQKAMTVAQRLSETGSKAQVWIAKDALKELEKLVKVEGRGRLIAADSKMGMEAANDH